jgi:hypothetical protein
MFIIMLRPLLISTLIFSVPLAHAQQRERISVQDQPRLSASQIARRVLPSVVSVVSDCAGGRAVFGSGFVVRRGLVATNRHVVECPGTSHVTLVGQETRHRVTARYFDTEHDLALLQVEGLRASPPLPVSDAQNLSVGDRVYAAGNPQGLEGTFSDGIISSLRYAAGRIQFTAAVSPGSSGGPVVDERGRVIGVTISSVTGGQNLNFAVPTLFLNTLIARVTRGEVPNGILADRNSRPTNVAAAPTIPPSQPTPRANALGYSLIIDNSSTLRNQLMFVKRMARMLVERSAPEDGALITSFRYTGAWRTAPFTIDRHELLASIEAIETSGERWTHPVIDTVKEMIRRSAHDTFRARSAIIVLTHGMDGVSRTSWDELRALARERRLPVYCVLFAPEMPDLRGYDTVRRVELIAQWQERVRLREQMLRYITEESGGRLFITQSEEQLSEFADALMRDLRAQSGNSTRSPALSGSRPALPH